MSTELYEYYERELEYLRHSGADFAKRYPRVAARLGLEPTKCDDPHVERLLEGFAFLAARVHLRLDDDYPELCEALLNVVHPQYIRPIPSLTIVGFELDPTQGKQTDGRFIRAGTTLLTPPVNGVPCKFRTCYDTTLWPVTVSNAQWTTPDRLRPAVRASDASGAIRLELKCLPEVSFQALALDTLRVHLSGSAPLVSTLYEVIANNTVRVLIRDLTPGSKRLPIELPASAVQQVGFAPNESLLPSSGRTFAGYQLLTEYFAFPEKFHFFDITGLEAVRAAGFGPAVEIVLLTSSFELPERRQALETGITASTFRLGCTPAVNLFQQTSDPILLTQKRYEHVVVPDVRRRLESEVFSVDDVRVHTGDGVDAVVVEPFYSVRHGAATAARGPYWLVRRRETPWRSDRATEVLLAFMDRDGQFRHPQSDTVTCALTCFNSDLPALLPFGDVESDFTIEGGGNLGRVSALVRPTSVIQPALGRGLMSRLVSQLSLNFLSLVDGGPDALREALRLHCFAPSEASLRHIASIRNVSTTPSHARVMKQFGMGIARGHRVEIEFDEEQFAGTSLFLFASVIERFLSMSASLNSFVQLTGRSTRRRRPLREWTPRSGWKTLL